MRVLVTGGTGFVGAHLSRALLGAGHQVRLMGRDFSGVQDCLASGASACQADLRDAAATVEACRGVEAVMHVGAFSSPWGKLSDFMAVNVEGTRAVLKGCEQFGVRRLVHVSSPAVIFTGEDHVMEQDTVPYPKRFTSHYAWTKKLAEDLVMAVHQRHRFNPGAVQVVVLRPKAIYGPGDRSLLPRLIAAAKAGRLPQIGDGQNLVDLTHVDDVVQSLLCALELPGLQTDWPVFTITGGEHIRLWQAIRQLLEGLGIGASLRRVPVGVALGLARGLEWMGVLGGHEPRLTRYGVQILARTQTYDISRAKDFLGYVPGVPFEAGLQDTLKALEEASR